jgi:hypothetical protein
VNSNNVNNNKQSKEKEKHLPVASKCLAIVLLPQKKQKDDDATAIDTKNGKSATHSHRDVGKEEEGYSVDDTQCNVQSFSHNSVKQNNTNYNNNSAVQGHGLSHGLTNGLSSSSSSQPNTVSGKELLDDFKQQNQTCYWNPALVESIKHLEYLGFVEPCTVLVSGEDIHLENLRSAWGRRVLKAPNNYTIDRIGK